MNKYCALSKPVVYPELLDYLTLRRLIPIADEVEFKC